MTGVLHIMRGYSGSGKTTQALRIQADDPSVIISNRDSLRKMMFPAGASRKTKLSGEQEQQVTVAQKASVRALLREGHYVIVDDTNLHNGFYAQWVKLAKSERAAIRSTWFSGVDLEQCIEGNKMRQPGDRVSDGVIRQQVKKYPAKKWRGLREWDPAEVKPYERPPSHPRFGSGLPTTVVCDLDGTLAHANGRDIYDGSRVNEDLIDGEVAYLLMSHLDTHGDIIFMSGRDAKYREVTQEWLDSWGFGGHPLYMRPEGDTRPDWEVKSELFDEHLNGKVNILAMFDDRDQVVRMWRAKGLKVLQVADGDF